MNRPNVGKKWTEEQDSILRNLCKGQNSVDQIAKIMGRDTMGILYRCLALEVRPETILKRTFVKGCINQNIIDSYLASAVYNQINLLALRFRVSEYTVLITLLSAEVWRHAKTRPTPSEYFSWQSPSWIRSGYVAQVGKIALRDYAMLVDLMCDLVPVSFNITENRLKKIHDLYKEMHKVDPDLTSEIVSFNNAAYFGKLTKLK